MALTQVAGGMIASSQTITSPTLTAPIVSTTMGVGGATPAASGSGITFPATQSASSDANTLDDYEEGTFNPIYVATGGGTITMIGSSGQYVKIGRFVYCSVEMVTSAISGLSGYMMVGNLPFLVANVRYPGSMNVGYAGNFTTNAPESGYTNQNSTTAFLTYRVSATAWAELPAGYFSGALNANYLIATFLYETAT